VDFCKTFDKQMKLHKDESRLAVEETIRICKENGVLVEYLSRKRQEVEDIMLTLFNQQHETNMMLLNCRRESLQEGKQEGLEEGLQKGQHKGAVKTTVEDYQEFGKTPLEALSALVRKFGPSNDEAMAAVSQYWQA